MGLSRYVYLAFGFPTGRNDIYEDCDLGRALVAEGLFPEICGTANDRESQTYVVVKASRTEIDLNDPPKDGTRVPMGIESIEVLNGFCALHERAKEFGVNETKIGWYVLPSVW